MEQQPTAYARFSGVISNELEGDTVLLMLTTGMYYALNAVGTSVWRRLEVPCRAQELADRIGSEFGVPAETAAADLRVFLDELMSDGLITPAANAGPALVPDADPGRVPTPAPSSGYAGPRLERGLLRNAAHSPSGTRPDGGHFPGGTCQYS
jgi:hypothetical protein